MIRIKGDAAGLNTQSKSGVGIVKVHKKCPQIVIASEEHEQLMKLGWLMLERAPAAPALLEELSRATVVAAEGRPTDALGMNDVVTFEYDGVKYRNFRLVYPKCADITEGNISVLTPVGTMLIGLSEGQSISWATSDGRDHELTVLKVKRPNGAVTARLRTG